MASSEESAATEAPRSAPVARLIVATVGALNGMRAGSSRISAALTPSSLMFTTTVCTTSAIANTPKSFGATILRNHNALRELPKAPNDHVEGTPRGALP